MAAPTTAAGTATFGDTKPPLTAAAVVAATGTAAAKAAAAAAGAADAAAATTATANLVHVELGVDAAHADASTSDGVCTFF